MICGAVAGHWDKAYLHGTELAKKRYLYPVKERLGRFGTLEAIRAELRHNANMGCSQLLQGTKGTG